MSTAPRSARRQMASQEKGDSADSAEGVSPDLDSSGEDPAGGDGRVTSNKVDLVGDEGGDGPRSAQAITRSKDQIVIDQRRVKKRESTVELRRSCDYCVRLKRACDGKSPCTLCSRRKKPCTRSARKKSGPAKGTKYAPRRKRSAIAEWADRASGAVAAVGGQRGASDLPPREAWALGPERSGEGGGHARMSPSLSPLLHAAPMSPSSFLGHRAMSASVGRGQSPQGLGGRGAPQHGRGSGFDPLSPSHSRRAGGITPFRSESFSKLEPGTGEAAAMRSSSAGVGGRRLAPQTELAGKSPPITGYQASPRPESPAAFSEQYRQEQHRRSESSAAATSWAAEGTSRSGLSRLEAEAAAEVEAVAASSGGGEAGYSVPPAGPDRGAPSSFLSHSGFPAIGAGRSDPRRAREPPVDWGRSSSPPRGMFASSPSGLSHGGRMRQLDQSLSRESGSSLQHQQSPGERGSTMSPRNTRGSGSGGDRPPSRSPEGGHRRGSGDERELESSSPALPFRPPPREPPDPLAGFGFRPTTQLMSWKRFSHFVPWDAHGRDPLSLMARRRPPPSPPREARGRSLESEGGGDGGGIGSGDDSRQERRWTLGMREEGDDVQWRQHQQQLPPPLSVPRMSAGSPPRRFDYHHRPRDWGPYGGGDEGGTHYSGTSSVTSLEGGYPGETLGEGGGGSASAAGVYERQEGTDVRPEDRRPTGGPFRGREGGFSSGGGGEGGGETRDRRMSEEEQQWYRSNIRHQGRPYWGGDQPGMGVLSPSLLSGEPGAEPRRSEEERLQRIGEGGRSSAAGGLDLQERGGRQVRRWRAEDPRGLSSEFRGAASEGTSYTASRGSVERELPGAGGGVGEHAGSPASRSSLGGRRSPMEVGSPRVPATTREHEGGERREESGSQRESEARNEIATTRPAGAGEAGAPANS